MYTRLYASRYTVCRYTLGAHARVHATLMTVWWCTYTVPCVISSLLTGLLKGVGYSAQSAPPSSGRLVLAVLAVPKGYPLGFLFFWPKVRNRTLISS